MINPDQEKMFDVLKKQRQHQLKVDRVLKIVLPIVAFLVATICANINAGSMLGTLIVLVAALWMVSIKRQPLGYWLVVILLYCLIDNYLSYDRFYLSGFSRQFGTMFTFVGIFGIGRPYIDRWLMKD
jgi:hypothetical protein